MTSETVTGRRTHNDYHVGWVCALPTEQTAAIAMLDQRHNSLPKPPNDNNTYTLGSVGKHTVVIACLPKGKIGNVSAATVATTMVSTFPNIKFCLMVGIGGGIPPKVRLGDVVVSTPVGAFPGVVQYDLGKAHQGGTFERTGALNSPPNALLAALTMVESEHDLTGSRIPDYLEELEKRWPRLAPKYLRSYSLKDQLFKANYRHVSKSTADKRVALIDDQEAEESDAEDDCRFCDTGQTVKRKPREMRVHYGLIASGNEVIKDSIFRDKLNTDLGGHVLCVEMEAAGLAHNFPCITIRGICDYADSHKNKAWQAHAAAVAAAFAKELLGQVQANDIEGEPTAKKILSEIHETILQTDSNIREVKRKMDRKEDVDILEWLTPVNYGPQHSDILSQRQEGTCKWLLTSGEFQEWIETGKTLFCPGVPGAGKTILTSIVIDELTTRFRDDKTIGIAYIYGNYRQHNEQKLDHLLKNLLKQLVQGLSSMPASVKALYDRHSVRETRASVDEVSATIQCIAGLYARIFIVVDALDELKETDGCRNRFLEEIFELQAQCWVKLFATSRFIPEIMCRFEGSATIHIRAQDEDVQGFLDGKISQSGQLLQTHREIIKTEIAKAVDGMFLLAHLHFDSVSTKLTLKQIKAALNSLSSGPRAYDVAYKKSMERIASQRQSSKELAMKVLSWITYAKRVLTTLELQHALAVEESDAELDNENLYRIEYMVSVCSGLVAVDEESGIIRLVHYTTQEYLDRTRNEWFSNTESEITMNCIRYLSFGAFRGSFCTNWDDYEDRMLRYPFYMYASHNWGHHALMASMDGDKVILDFLESPAKLYTSVHAIMVSKLNRWQDMEDISHMVTEVPTAAYFGLSSTIFALLEKGHHADSEGIAGWTPLLYAARYGHGEVVKHLIARNDVDPNFNDRFYRLTPLSWAAKNGHVAVVKLLLGNQAIVPEYVYLTRQTPLPFAAENGHLEVVRLLLSRHDVDPNSRTPDNRTALSWAAQKGHTAIVKLLLKQKWVVTNYQDTEGRTPLSYAAENGHEAVVRLLLAIDTLDASRSDSRQWTPLNYAVECGHRGVVELLLPRTRVTQANRLLGSAANNGYERILTLLANSSAIPDRQGKDQKTVVKVHGTGTPDADFWLFSPPVGQLSSESTTLRWAVKTGQLALAEALLQKGADIDAPRETNLGWEFMEETMFGEDSMTALHLAANNGQKAMVSLLLDHGADINDHFTQMMIGQDSFSRREREWEDKDIIRNKRIPGYYVVIEKKQAVHLAAEGGYKSIVALLLSKGAKVCPKFIN